MIIKKSQNVLGNSREFLNCIVENSDFPESLGKRIRYTSLANNI